MLRNYHALTYLWEILNLYQRKRTWKITYYCKITWGRSVIYINIEKEGLELILKAHLVLILSIYWSFCLPFYCSLPSISNKAFYYSQVSNRKKTNLGINNLLFIIFICSWFNLLVAFVFILLLLYTQMCKLNTAIFKVTEEKGKKKAIYTQTVPHLSAIKTFSFFQRPLLFQSP